MSSDSKRGATNERFSADKIAILGGGLVIPLVLVLGQIDSYVAAKASLRVALPVLIAVSASGAIAGLVQKRRIAAPDEITPPLVVALRIAVLATLGAISVSALYHSADILIGSGSKYHRVSNERFYIGILFAVLPALFLGFAAFRIACPARDLAVESTSAACETPTPRVRMFAILGTVASLALATPMLSRFAKGRWIQERADVPPVTDSKGSVLPKAALLQPTGGVAGTAMEMPPVEGSRSKGYPKPLKLRESGPLREFLRKHHSNIESGDQAALRRDFAEHVDFREKGSIERDAVLESFEKAREFFIYRESVSGELVATQHDYYHVYVEYDLVGVWEPVGEGLGGSVESKTRRRLKLDVRPFGYQIDWLREAPVSSSP